ncbi:MAG TPA: hypothetical protein VJV21_01900 [Pyrinomonadaceae bacterium]|nr:hypothetical protein [Pyrinomonadaceae bacterium]
MKRATAYFVVLTLVCLSLVACSKESKTVSGSVIRGERARYTVNARAGQTLAVNVTSEEDNAVFQIYLPGEKGTLPGAGETDDAKKFSGKVPTDGEYVIVVGPTRGNTTYKLSYSVK